jgi:CheY-like chemotaxis protein
MDALKILLVDDDNDIRNMYAEVFKKKGFAVSEATNGAEGLEQATKNLPDVIFTGIVMPVMDGFQLMEALKKNIATNNIPVVISSHLGREEDREKAQKLGAKEFFVRGFYTPYEIAEKIRAIFKAQEYKLKFNPAELDAKKLFDDMHLKENPKCFKCGGELILALKLTNVEKYEFTAKFVCAECGAAQE